MEPRILQRPVILSYVVIWILLKYEYITILLSLINRMTMENLNYFCRLGTVDFMPTFRELPKMQCLSVIHLTRDIDLSLFHNNRRKCSDHTEAHYSVISMGFMSFSHSCGASIEFSLSVYPSICTQVTTIEQHNELKRYPILVNYTKRTRNNFIFQLSDDIIDG